MLDKFWTQTKIGQTLVVLHWHGAPPMLIFLLQYNFIPRRVQKDKNIYVNFGLLAPLYY